MNLKKTLSLLMACMMAFALLTVSAGAVTITMDIKGDANAQFAAYRLLTLTTSKKVDAAEDDKDPWNYAYDVNEKYADILKEVTGGADNDAILAYVNAETFNPREFADAVYEKLRTAGTVADATAVNGKFDVPDQGYYLIVETNKGGNSDSYSLAMLDTAGQTDLTVTTKENVPTLEKKILVNGAPQDFDFAAFDDTVKYQITLTVPEDANMESYDKYAYVVHDTISEGLSYTDGTVNVSIPGVGAVPAYTVSTEACGVDGCNCNLHISFADIKGAFTGATERKIVITYDCTVNPEHAVVGGKGNPNDAYLEFSNNPYGGGTGITPKDEVTVFTFKLDVNKVRKVSDTETAPLAGAEFKLYKNTGSDAANPVWEEVAIDGGSIADGQTTFTFRGLDVGQYKLEETKVPAGYQKCDDVLFTVSAEAVSNNDGISVNSLSVVSDGDAEFSADKTTGVISTNIVNVTGNRLPSTGGIGVYGLYAGGALLIVLAFVAVSMNRKKKTND